LETIVIPFASLRINIDDIYLGLGYGGLYPPDDIRNMVDSMLISIREVCKPSYCYLIKEVEEIDKLGITIDGIRFTTGKIIASYLDQAEKIAFFVATAGKEYEAWLKTLHEEGDIWNMFLADIIGSEIAEATARAVGEDLEKYARLNGSNISNSYSPGYCGWTVKEQQKLFSFFPSPPCGVTLTDSSLMLPIKSVSGIIALGKQIEKKAYGCDICMMKSCYKKRASSA